MAQYKLMYFNFRGAAEDIRMLFALKGRDFEDYRFKEGEWPGELKGNADLFPLGQAPVLLVDGKPIPQRKAIARHLAREFGLYGSNHIEAAKIDVVSETVHDIITLIIAIYQEKDEAKKAEAVKNVRDNSGKPPLTYLNNFVKKAGGRYFVGKSATLADVYVYTMVDNLITVTDETSVNENYPDLVKFYKGIKENSPLTSYIAKRL